MNEMQTTGARFFKELSRFESVPSRSTQRLTGRFMHPSEVADDTRLTQADKREVLASWAADVHAVPGAPALRRLDNGAVFRVDDVLRAQKSLDDGEETEQPTFDPFRSFAGPGIRLPSRLMSALRRNRPDDDDEPPPCPATIMRPLGGPPTGGESADLGLALAA